MLDNTKLIVHKSFGEFQMPPWLWPSGASQVSGVVQIHGVEEKGYIYLMATIDTPGFTLGVPACALHMTPQRIPVAANTTWRSLWLSATASLRKLLAWRSLPVEDLKPTPAKGAAAENTTRHRYICVGLEPKSNHVCILCKEEDGGYTLLTGQAVVVHWFTESRFASHVPDLTPSHRSSDLDDLMTEAAKIAEPGTYLMPTAVVRELLREA